MKSDIANIISDKSIFKIYSFIILLMLLILSIDQIYTLVKFAYDYNFSYFSGEIMTNICNNKSYVEYETKRFQINKDLEKLKIKNTVDSNNYQDNVVYVCLIFLLIYISLSFILIYSNQYISYINNVQNINNLNMSMMHKFMYFLHFITSLYIIGLIPMKVLKKHIFSDIYELQDIINLKYVLILSFFIHIYMTYNKLNDVSLFAFLVVSIIWYKLVQIMNIFIEERENKNKSLNDENKYIYTKNAIIQLFEYIFKSESNDYKKIVNKLLYIIIFGIFAYLIFNIVHKYVLNNNANDFHMIFGKSDFDSIILLRFLVYPIIVIFVLFCFVAMTRKYNSFINEYILLKPYYLYKQNIKNISNIFDKMIDNNMSTIKNVSVCKNIANAVHMTLYSSIFANINDDKLMFNHILPRLEYDIDCDKDTKLLYNEIVEYKPLTYLKNNFFIKQSKCNSVDNLLLISVIQSNFDQSINNFVNKLKFAISNVLNGKTYNGKTNLVYSNDYKANNTITYIKPSEMNYIDNDTNDLIDDISNIYVSYLNNFKEYTIKMHKKLRECNNQSISYGNFVDIKTSIKSFNDEYSQNIKIIYINRFFDMIDELFMKINDLMTTRITYDNKNKLLSKFIINNYNTFQTQFSLFRKDDFVKIYKGIISDDDLSYGIEEIEDLKEDIYDNINIIYDMKTSDDMQSFENSNTRKIKKINILYSNLKEISRIYDEKYQYINNINDLFIKMYDKKKEYNNQHINNIQSFLDVINSKPQLVYDAQNIVAQARQNKNEALNAKNLLDNKIKDIENKQNNLSNSSDVILSTIQSINTNSESDSSINDLTKLKTDIINQQSDAATNLKNKEDQYNESVKSYIEVLDQVRNEINKSLIDVKNNGKNIDILYQNSIRSMNKIDTSLDIEFKNDEITSKNIQKRASETSSFIYIISIMYILIYYTIHIVN